MRECDKDIRQPTLLLLASAHVSPRVLPVGRLWAGKLVKVSYPARAGGRARRKITTSGAALSIGGKGLSSHGL
jgi:hypothetical protein